MTETLEDDDVEYARSCPNVHFLFPGRKKFAETIRKPLKNFVNNICPSRKTIKRKLRASEFQAGNAGHMNILKDMGITLMALPDGRVQLLHTTSSVSFNFFCFVPLLLSFGRKLMFEYFFSLNLLMTLRKVSFLCKK